MSKQYSREGLDLPFIENFVTLFYGDERALINAAQLGRTGNMYNIKALISQFNLAREFDYLVEGSTYYLDIDAFELCLFEVDIDYLKKFKIFRRAYASYQSAERDAMLKDLKTKISDRERKISALEDVLVATNGKLATLETKLENLSIKLKLTKAANSAPKSNMFSLSKTLSNKEICDRLPNGEYYVFARDETGNYSFTRSKKDTLYKNIINKASGIEILLVIPRDDNALKRVKVNLGDVIKFKYSNIEILKEGYTKEDFVTDIARHVKECTYKCI